LKHVFLIDVCTIALLFVVRATAGSLAVDTPLSGWLVGCTGLLAVFLALAKRQGELFSAAPEASRPVLARYARARLDLLVPAAAAAALAAYVAYALTGPTAPTMALTIPLAAVGLVRYTMLVQRGALAEEPERTLFHDRPLVLIIAAWAALATALLAVEV
jgi:4-hydroxybenzoate polyprenyltransferase